MRLSVYAGYVVYYVQEGDTLAMIADRYNGVGVDKLLELNSSAEGECLDPDADLTGSWETINLPLGGVLY